LKIVWAIAASAKASALAAATTLRAIAVSVRAFAIMYVAIAALKTRNHATTISANRCELRTRLPRVQFDMTLQASIGSN
jgi:hypothetical protein